MNSRWTSHLKGSDKENFESVLNNSRMLLDRLKTILEQEEAAVDNSDTSIEDFEEPNWAYKQAFRNGQRNILKKLYTLV